MLTVQFVPLLVFGVLTMSNRTSRHSGLRPNAAAMMTVQPVVSHQNIPPIPTPANNPQFVPPTIIVPAGQNIPVNVPPRAFAASAPPPKKSSSTALILTTVGIFLFIGFLFIAGKILNFRWSSLRDYEATERQDTGRISGDERRHQNQKWPREAAMGSLAASGVCDTHAAHPEQHHSPNDGPRHRSQEARRQCDAARNAPEQCKAAAAARPIFRSGFGARTAWFSHGWQHRNRMQPVLRHGLPGSAGRARRHRNRTRNSPPSWA